MPIIDLLSSRLAWEFRKRFRNSVYAREELVAELSVAFLCADLSTSEPREDHVACALAEYPERGQAGYFLGCEPYPESR